MPKLEFAKNVGYVTMRLIAGALLGLATSAVIARVLGPQNNGIYSFAILLITTASAIGGLGIGPAAVFHLGQTKHSVEQIVTKLFGISVIAGLSMSITLAIIWLLAGDLLKTKLDIEIVSFEMLIVSIVLIPIITIYTNLICIFQGVNKFKLHGLFTLLPVMTTFVLCISFNNSLHYSAMPAIVYWGIGYAVSTGIIGYALRQQFVSFASSFLEKSYLAKELLSFGIRAHVGNIVALLNYRLNFYLLGVMSGPASLGLYAITTLLAESIWLLSTAVSTVLFPYVSRSNSEGSTSSNPTPFIARWVFVQSAILGVALFFINEPLIDAIFGRDYLHATTAVRLLIPGVVLWSVVRVVSNDIAGRGKPEINLYVAIATLILNLALNLLLIPKHGIEGAAAANSIAYGFCTLLVCVLYKRLAGISPVSLFVPRQSDFRFLVKIWRDVRIGKRQ